VHAVRDVVFDLGGVLIDWDPRYLFCSHLGWDRAATERFLRTVCTARWQNQLDRGRSFGTSIEELVRRFPDRREEVRMYGEGWERMFAGEHAQATAFLRELAARGYRLHALSNYPAEKVAFLYRAFPFMRVFETVVISGLIGIAKPDKAIFEYLLARIGGRPCLFVDDRSDNLDAASRCGMHTVQCVGGDVAPLKAVLGS
jgi:2-haloacid dehalogenase